MQRIMFIRPDRQPRTVLPVPSQTETILVPGKRKPLVGKMVPVQAPIVPIIDNRHWVSETQVRQAIAANRLKSCFAIRALAEASHYERVKREWDKIMQAYENNELFPRLRKKKQPRDIGAMTSYLQTKLTRAKQSR